MSDATAPAPRLGIRANLSQFLFLVAVSALVGGTVGQERAIVPLLAQRTFGVRAGGLLADAFGLSSAIAVVAAVTAASGAVVAVRMVQTSRPGGS